MSVWNVLVLWFFGASMFINGCLFIPQAIKIFKMKSAKDISLITFAGFCIIQLSAVIHGYVHNDPALMWGMGYSLITCGIVTTLAFIYRKR